MKEVEIKGWVDDFEGVKRRIEDVAEEHGTLDKRDLYYAHDSKPAMGVDVMRDKVFRLRNEGDKWYVTAKDREVEDMVELNQEIEFAVSDPSSFRRFAQYLGYRPFVVKRKETRKYTYGRATLELSRIEPLGDFLEVEVLLDDDAPDADIAEAAREVQALLTQFGVPLERVEPRPYVDMLRRIGSGRP